MSDTYEITEEFFLEMISYLKQKYGKTSVEELSKIRDDEENMMTKKFIQHEIDRLSNEFKICKNCFSELVPVIKKEYHTELEFSPFESFVDYYECESCYSTYDY